MKAKFFHIALVLLLIPILSGQGVLGQIPQTMSYQGLLTNGDGNAVPDDNYTLSFKLYDVAIGASDLWEETQVVVNSTPLVSHRAPETTAP